MKTFYRTPDVEDAAKSIILQNRCGNRLSLLYYDERTELELVYKPNAFRRKDLRARNFSNRDNFTTAFAQFTLPDITADTVTNYDYDPFVTRFSTETPSLARNTVAVVNIADHNAFALAARSPLLIALEPHAAFAVEDSLLMERFADRGEEIVSFVAFDSFEQNRYRVLDDGTHVLQIFENEVVIVGAEETVYHARHTIRSLAGLTLEQLIERNEQALAPALSKGVVSVKDERLQRVLDLNRRMVYSGLDEGGACFGAINRLYHLLWVRDGAMTTSLMARSGNPDYLRIFAPFLLANPSYTRRDDGTRVPEFLQIIGTRWTKSEDDGIFYALLSMFTHFIVTGDDSLVQGGEMAIVLDAVDRFLEKAWEPDRGLIGSDTRGESPLASNPYFGYDIVNGKVEAADSHEGGGNEQFRRLARCYSLYYNVNTYNLLLMAVTLLEQRPRLDNGRSERYAAIAAALQGSITTDFVDPTDGCLYASFERYTDGEERWMSYSSGVDYWEYAWAVSLGPFYPAPTLQLRSARQVRQKWPAMADYGFCPWNTISRMLREYGMSSDDYQAMLAEEIDDALTEGPRYPMYASLGEYWRGREPGKMASSWRALPFTAGSLFYSVTSLVVQSLPMGIAVRASALVDSVSAFQYRLARIDIVSEGGGDTVGAVIVNGEPLDGTLQVPERRLRPGANTIRITRAGQCTHTRLYASNAELIDCRQERDYITYRLHSPAPAQLVFENLDKADAVSLRQQGEDLAVAATPIDNTNKTLITAPTSGDFELRLRREA
ncbi:MAG: hypothetical protein GF331_12345 [Chitinivibrionales bacterium]|nr:hypothetical protein [Chitinivibrionales bacterium]